MPGSMMSSSIDGVLVLAGEPQAVGAVVRDVDRESLGLEAALQPLGEAHFVVDHQQAHGSIVADAALNRR